MTTELDFLQEIGIQQLTAANTITHTDRLKVAICGEKKSGKSNLVARTARKPLLVYDFDDRKESIAGANDTYIKTLVDSDSTMPSAWSSLETDLGSIEYAKKQGKLILKSICLDSATFLRQVAENQMMKETGMMRRAKIGLKDYRIAQGWDAINYVHRMLYELLRRLFALDIDIYVIFHTRQEKDKSKSTKEETIYTDRLTVDPQNLEVLLTMFNETWRTYINDAGEYRLQVRQDWRFNAATALKVGADEPQDIQLLLREHEENLKK